jgi:hypothetical protein
MKLQTRKFNVFFVIATLTILVLVTSACAFQPLLLGAISPEVDITLDEELFSQSRPTFKVHNHNIWADLDVNIDRMELHDGYIRFLGTQYQPDGSLANCSIDLALGAKNGLLAARIIAVDIPGISVKDPVVVDINRDMAVSLLLNDVNMQAGVYFKEVQVTEDALRMKVQVNVEF